MEGSMAGAKRMDSCYLWSIGQTLDCTNRVEGPPASYRCGSQTKPNYTIPKASRPLSLLSTLGKILELVIARRLAYWAETHDLLPINQFGARPRRSWEQAVVLLVEKMKEAWRRGEVLSLVSFDVKGAYNGVPREVMAARLRQNGIPANVVRVLSFCSNRRATVALNGFQTKPTDIAFPGLPQGSPLSPILYLFSMRTWRKLRTGGMAR
jgi:hypothetical protein